MNAFILLEWYWCFTKKTSLDETYSFWNVEFRAPLTLSQMSYLANRTIEKMKFLHIAFLIVGIVSVCLYWPNLYFFFYSWYTWNCVFSFAQPHRFFCYFEIMWVVDQDTQNRFCLFKFLVILDYSKNLQHGWDFPEKGQRNVEKGQNIQKFGKNV